MSKKVKRILSIFTLIILSLSLTCASIFLIRFTTHIKLKSSDFANGSVGVLGGYLESKTALVTKEYIPTKGLEITSKFDSDSSYAIYWYDENKQYCSFSEYTDKAFNIDVNPLYYYCKIELRYDDNRDVTLFNRLGLIKDFEISYDKNQSRTKVEKDYKGLKTALVCFEDNTCRYMSYYNIDTYRFKLTASEYEKVTHVIYTYNFKVSGYDTTKEGISLYGDYSVLVEKSTFDNDRMLGPFISTGWNHRYISSDTDLKTIQNWYLRFRIIG